MSHSLDLSLGSKELLDLILRDPQLPSPPMLALQVVRKVSDPDCEVDDVTQLLMQDAALCGRLLNAVNSAFFSPNRPVTTVKQAVVILGYNRVRSMVLGLSLPVVKFRVDSDAGLNRYWKSSVTGAMIARELATHLRYPAPDDDLIAALLRDLGMVLLRQVLGDAYWPVWSGQYGLWGNRQTEWERQILGFDHAEVSARLLEQWGLPKGMVGPVRYHHDPAALPSPTPQTVRRAHLLDLASRMALLAEDDQPPEAIQDILRIAQEQFTLDFASLESLLTAVLPKIDEFAGVLKVDIGARPDFAAVLVAGAAELTRLTVPKVTAASAPTKAASGFETDHGSTGKTASELGSPQSAAKSRKATTTVVDLSSADFQWGAEGGYSLPVAALVGRPDVAVRLRNYELIKELGRGAMGIVLLAKDRALNRLVAIKMLAPDQVHSALALKRFAREARLAAAIRHENVVTVFAVHELRGMPFLVMEYIQGRSLQDWLDAGRGFSVAEIVRIGQQVAAGLAAAHSLRLIHRDVKPANVLLEDRSERVRLTDFGLARDVDDTAQLTAAGDMLGTPLYMSPEQVVSGRLGPATDMFSLGSLLYLLSTGQTAFRAESAFDTMRLIAFEMPRPVQELSSTIPNWLAGVIAALHAKNPADRPGAAAVAAILANRPG